MRVKALKDGEYDFTYNRKGTVFEILDEPKHDQQVCLSCEKVRKKLPGARPCIKAGKPECFSGLWMVEVHEDTPVTPHKVQLVAGRKPKIVVKMTQTQAAVEQDVDGAEQPASRKVI
jgi:hypothetical protein